MSITIKLLVVQRISLSNDALTSRSISARFGPLLNYMTRHGMLRWHAISEDKIKYQDLKNYDALIFNKHTSLRALDIMRIANALGLKTIYDLDDWILNLPDYSVTNLDEDTLANIGSMIREATYVTVSNPLIASKLKSFRDKIHIIPNGFDFEGIPSNPNGFIEAKPPKILFSNTDGLKLESFRIGFLQALHQFMQRHESLTLEFWGDIFPEVYKIPRVKLMGFLPNEIYKRTIRDAGYLFSIVPLGGSEDPESIFFNSCKSCIKYIDYGALGIPAIYSQTPVYSSVIVHRKTGLLAENTVDSWQQEMESMYSDSNLRECIRLNAYSDSKAQFSLGKPAQRLISLLS